MSVDPLRIMVIDEDADRGRVVADALRAAGYVIVGHAGADDDLLPCVKQAEPDIILVTVDAPSRDTLEQLGIVHRENPRPMVMFSRADDGRIVADAIRAGVSAYITEGLTTARVRPIIEVAIAQFRHIQALRRELDETRTTLADRKLVDRAKGVLMAGQGLSEPQAYRMLQKLAMDRKLKLADAARNIIESHPANPSRTST